jgi:hypothetical protein
MLRERVLLKELILDDLGSLHEILEKKKGSQSEMETRQSADLP